MKKFATLAVLAATSALALGAGAANAQPYGRYDDARWAPVGQRLAQLDRRIDRGVRSGDLTRQEAWRLRGEFNHLARLEARYRVGGLSNWERADLNRRIDRLADQIRYERRDGSHHGYGPRY